MDPHRGGGRRWAEETFVTGSLSSFDTDDSDILSAAPTDGLLRPSSSLRFLVGDMSGPFYFPPWRLFKGSSAPCAYAISVRAILMASFFLLAPSAIPRQRQSGKVTSEK